MLLKRRLFAVGLAAMSALPAAARAANRRDIDAILARGEQPVEVQRGLPGDPEDEQSRYLEAEVFGIRVAGIYLPNGNPQPGPKFDYKLRWMDRLATRMTAIYAQEVPADPQ